MKVNHELMRVMRAGKISRNPREAINAGAILGICLFLALLILLVFVKEVGASEVIKDSDAINAIIGEAEGESYLGKIAVAQTILNRGHLKGVYGGKSQRVLQHKYSATTYNDAKSAWEYAKLHRGNDWLATGWGNAGDIQQFKRQGWFKNCVITAHLGGHYFYREVK